ncbi:MAG: nucleotidyl transferase AbiEii/AbiGii toxin family protein [Negativicoccus succinicivorans]|uniref:nucleotidyl transferase AbiEii/AbiGii toxin family protein n=1 Tax=Negativicoccus succinicivorans TaxID=620903 RepID=UPI0029029D90|nr:nucleotidyl transferase AbiEii/AbiGii toxin family protein [Negativicoccus succinicivorans]MDU1066576.1 nucleotidyl transferase AbiEii/AbiGii toxin family protein [Negativicoccus succinicivorans]MDU5585070.1 nucleotidyl transferase AbiEii/AbiGii toxin family protein [Pseudomonas aeruginosa]
MEGETALMCFYKLDPFSEDIDLDAKGSLPKVEKILQEIIKENKWKYKITKNADTVFRMMIDYGGKMI